MRRALLPALLLALSLLAPSVQADPVAHHFGGSAAMELTSEVPYSDGMHLLVATIRGRDVLFASSVPGPIRIFDIANPARPKPISTVPCGGGQAVLQLSHDKKTLIVAEGAPHGLDPCMAPDSMGFYTIDISNLAKPRPLGYGVVPRSGHTATAHPTKPILYVSYGDVAPANRPPEFEVWSIENPSEPEHLATPAVTGVHGPHDITFNANGTRAVMSSMTAIQVFDTTDPAEPRELEVLQCPGCTHNHEAHFTSNEKHVVVSDETTGGGASPCPMGGLYFYGWDPKDAPHMELIGEWQPAEFLVPAASPTNVPLCTPHVFDISRDGKKIAASWHTGGVRVVDITSMNGVGVGTHGEGAKEIAWSVTDGADAWSAKFDPSGRYVYVNDRNYGLQIYRLGTP